MTTTTKPAPLGAWTDDENRVIARAYLNMLRAELAGAKYNKAATRRAGLEQMAATRDDGRARSAGSWEMKCCNISAVLDRAGLRYIRGYKPLGHGQARPLALALARQLEREPDALHMAAADILRKMAQGGDA